MIIEPRKKPTNHNSLESPTASQLSSQAIDFDKIKGINIKKRTQSEVSSEKEQPKPESEKRFKKAGAELEPAFDEDRLSKLSDYEEAAKSKMLQEREKKHHSRKNDSKERTETPKTTEKSPEVLESGEIQSKRVSEKKKKTEVVPEPLNEESVTATPKERDETGRELNRTAAEYKHKGDTFKKQAATEPDKLKKKYDLLDSISFRFSQMLEIC
jgi:hypothetical protein